jgi:hypothetical protein
MNLLIKANLTLVTLCDPFIILGTIFFGFLYSVILALFIKTKKQL